ncbi:SWIM zinc finger family protein [Desulfovibrio mangrovi]
MALTVCNCKVWRLGLPCRHIRE